MAKNKVLNHINSEEIIEWLTAGESVRSIAAKLKSKYPTRKNLHISTVTLQHFRKNRLKLEGVVLADIQEAEREKYHQEVRQEEQRKLEASASYQSAIQEIAGSKLDVARKILGLDKIIEKRIEYWYNKVASGEVTDAKGDKELRGFIDRMMALLAQYKKYVEGVADKTIDHNVNITVMNDQISVITDAIYECLGEFEPEVAIRFMEKLSSKLQNTSYRPQLSEKSKFKDCEDIDFELLESGETDE